MACSSVWHFCGARSRDKLKLLNKQVLRVVLNDFSSSYERLLSKVNMTSLQVQYMLILVYKCLADMAPAYLSSYFKARSSPTSYEKKTN